MKNGILWLVAVFTLAVFADPVKVIFDTDMYTDFDDAGALACLHALADAGECEILATVACTRDCHSVAICEIINAYYGRPDIPVGCSREIGRTGSSPRHEFRYGDAVRKYAKWVRHSRSDHAPDANEIYRRVLAAQPDNSVVLCSVGFLTNMRRLLETGPDDISPLDGRTLVARKIHVWVAMACRYPQGWEYNSGTDYQSSRLALENWPTPVVFTDWNLGIGVYAGRALADLKVKDNPVAEIFAKSLNDSEALEGTSPHGWDRRGRASWDETAVLIAVRGAEAYFNVHRGTYRMVGEKGEDEWCADEEKGPHIRVTEKVNAIKIGRIIDELMCRGPKSPIRL